MARLSLAVIVLMVLSLSTCVKRATEPAPTMRVRFDNETPLDARRSQRAAMRDYLWTHWRERRPAALVVTHISKEGKQTDSSYEIKFVPPTTFLLHVADTRYRYGYNGQVFKYEEAKHDIYTVERVLPSEPCPFDLNATVEVLPDNARLSGFDYCLRFTGWGDEIEGSL
jgi:hypothetical protein